MMLMSVIVYVLQLRAGEHLGDSKTPLGLLALLMRGIISRVRLSWLFQKIGARKKACHIYNKIRQDIVTDVLSYC